MSKLGRAMEVCQIIARVGMLTYLLLSCYVMGVVLVEKSLFGTNNETSSTLKRSIRGGDSENLTSTSPPRALYNASSNKTETMVPTSTFPNPTDDPYFELLLQQGSLRSADHHRKFLARKSTIEETFEKNSRYQSRPGEYAAIVLSDAFAFLHIWKCGGTTMADQTGRPQHRLSEKWIQNRQWVAFVRDPIDRFLSAWAECGFRQYSGEISFGGLEAYSTLSWLDGSYDFRVRAFLQEVKDFTFPMPSETCHTHAQPQANFMINEQGKLDEHVTLVGDLSEMKNVLEIAGFRDYSEHIIGRDSSSNQVKSDYFPSRRDLLEDQTLLDLCDFLALDYFLFDFDPPSICIQDNGPLTRFYKMR